jgi:hemolysin activation/secretion protein
VQVPPQDARGGVVVIQVVETPVGLLRVHGSRYFLPSEIKRKVPSLAEGEVIDFNRVNSEIIGLQAADRQVTPAVKAGVEPGTMDVDLNVKDTLPLHGNLELNNRRSADTTDLRLNGAVSYSNLWQLGHTAGLNFQVTPEDLNETKVFSAYYLAKVSSDWSLMTQATKQDSNVSTLGGMTSAGRGEIAGLRALLALPPKGDFSHSFSFGADYKHFRQGTTIGGNTLHTPIEYYPFSLDYTAYWQGKGSETDLDANVILHLRGLGGDALDFDTNRFKADGDFIYLRGSLSHTHDLPLGFQLFAKTSGQLSDQPLINTEQFSGGGLDTARGYLESAVMGDNALFGTLELRTPSLGGLAWLKPVNDWRFFVFGDAGMLNLRDALPDQTSHFELASVGAGSRLRLWEHANGVLTLGMPLIGQGDTHPGDWLLLFRVWADF